MQIFRLFHISVLIVFLSQLNVQGHDPRHHGNENKLTTPKQGKRTYKTVRISVGIPKIDGRLEDECWLKDGEWSGNYRQQMPVEGAEPSQETELKILYDDHYIYVGIRAYDDPENIIFRPATRDQLGGDMVGVAFDSYNDQRTAFEFNLSASGGKIDLLLMNVDDYDINWNAVWDGKTALEDSAWTAEMRIPLSQLRFANFQDQVWGLHAWRWHSRNSEESQWELIPRDTPSFLSEIGNLTGLEIPRKLRRLEVMPYGLGMLGRSEPEKGNPFATGHDHRISGGLDAKIGLTTDFTMDVAINPDFGQVEADPSVLNLSAVEILYEEKRPLFQEGSNILEYDFGFQNKLFYSRRIGQRPQYNPLLTEDEYSDIPDNTSIKYAVKVTGKNASGLSLGILQCVTAKEMAEVKTESGPSRYETVEPLTSYSVIRVQRDMNQANTLVGGILTATNRDLSEDYLNFLPHSAYTGGVDFQHQWKNKTYYVRIRSMFSSVHGEPEAITRLQYSPIRYLNRPDYNYLGIDSSFTSMTGSGTEFAIGKAGNGRLRYGLSASYDSPKFELNDIGYLRFTDGLRQTATLGYEITEPFFIFRSLSTSLSELNFFNMGGDYIYSSMNGKIRSRFENKWTASLNSSLRFEGLNTRELRGGPALILPRQWKHELNIQTDQSRSLVTRLEVNSNTSADNVSGSFSLHPGISVTIGNRAQMSGSLNYSHYKENLQWVGRRKVGSESRYILAFLDRKTMGFTIRADYGITPDLTLRYYGSPYVSTGIYTDFKRITDSRAEAYKDRFHVFTNPEIVFDPVSNQYLIDETSDGTSDYAFQNPDFNFKQFRSNMVLRWEYRPGSILYLVWQHSRTGYNSVTDHSLARGFSQLWDIYPTDIIMLKLNYWFSL